MPSEDSDEPVAELIEQLEEPSATPVPPVSESPIPGFTTETPQLTVEEAAQRLGPKVLQLLEEKFNGSLIDVRSPDERDVLF